MKTSKTKFAWMHTALCGCGLLAAINSTGCQIVEGSQTLPSAYYLDDDVQYHGAGPEFLLSREAAALKAARAEEALQ